MAIQNLEALINMSSRTMDQQTLGKLSSRSDLIKASDRLSTGKKVNTALDDVAGVTNPGAYIVRSSQRLSKNRQEFAQSMQSSLDANPNFLSITNPSDQNVNSTGTDNQGLQFEQEDSSQIAIPESRNYTSEPGFDTSNSKLQAAMDMFKQSAQNTSDLTRLFRN